MDEPLTSAGLKKCILSQRGERRPPTSARSGPWRRLPISGGRWLWISARLSDGSPHQYVGRARTDILRMAIDAAFGDIDLPAALDRSERGRSTGCRADAMNTESSEQDRRRKYKLSHARCGNRLTATGKQNDCSGTGNEMQAEHGRDSGPCRCPARRQPSPRWRKSIPPACRARQRIAAGESSDGYATSATE